MRNIGVNLPAAGGQMLRCLRYHDSCADTQETARSEPSLASSRHLCNTEGIRRTVLMSPCLQFLHFPCIWADFWRSYGRRLCRRPWRCQAARTSAVLVQSEACQRCGGACQVLCAWKARAAPAISLLCRMCADQLALSTLAPRSVHL